MAFIASKDERPQPLRVLVTGGRGLVGSAIQLVLSSRERDDYEFHFADSSQADLTNLNETRTLFDQIRPHLVIHLAAMVGGLFKNMNANLDFFLTNSRINENVLQASAEHQVQKCVSCLSTCIFPDKTTYPIDEKMIHNGPPHSSNYGYSYAKRMLDVLNHGYTDKIRKLQEDKKQDNCQVGSIGSKQSNSSIFTAIIPTNVYGPSDNFKLQDAHVIPALIHRAYLKAQQCRKENKTEAVLDVYGSGQPMRQFIYSLDLAKLIVWTLQHYEEVEPIILSVDECDEISIGQAAQVITNAMGQNFQIQFKLNFDTTQADGQHKKTASNAKLRSYLPDFEFTSFEKGIQETVNWFCQYYEIVRK